MNFITYEIYHCFTHIRVLYDCIKAAYLLLQIRLVILAYLCEDDDENSDENVDAALSVRKSGTNKNNQCFD